MPHLRLYMLRVLRMAAGCNGTHALVIGQAERDLPLLGIVRPQVALKIQTETKGNEFQKVMGAFTLLTCRP